MSHESSEPSVMSVLISRHFFFVTLRIQEEKYLRDRPMEAGFVASIASVLSSWCQPQFG